METMFNVAGMTCGGCEESITRALKRVPGVVAVRADHESGSVVVETEADAEPGTLATAIEDAGYDVLPDDSKRLKLL